LKENIPWKKEPHNIIWLKGKWNWSLYGIMCNSFEDKTILKQCWFKINIFSIHPQTHAHTEQIYYNKIPEGKMPKNWETGSHWQITFSTGIKKTTLLYQTKKSTITLQFYIPKL
jgi:hypothetical protein